MRIGTKILLLMLAITVGTSAAVAWIVTISVTRYETDRANDQISLAIAGYVRHLDDHYQQVNRIVRAMLEAQFPRSLVQASDDPAGASARAQLKLEVLGHDVQAELASPEVSPAFHVLANQANEVLVVAAPDDPKLESAISSDVMRWPVDAVLDGQSKPVIQYVYTHEGLFLAMGVPLRTLLEEPPSHAYFVGFRINDEWVRRQLLADRTAPEAGSVPLAAWFVVDGKIVARASTDPTDRRVTAFTANTPLRPSQGRVPTSGPTVERVEFQTQGEHFLGQAFNLNPTDARAGRLVLASSLDQALAALRALQRNILLTTLITCAVAVVACRFLANMISRPIQDLVAGTRRIAAGQFDTPVQSRRRDELGVLAESFNQMSQGLKERDGLREERVKIERDLAVARRIQMDVLPKELPACPGYDMAAYSLPAEQTGGDIYDLVAVALDPLNPADPPSLVLLLADATGHGIGPALSVTQVRSMLRIGVRLQAALEDVFAQINRQLCQDLGSDRFVTAFLGMLDPNAHHISYHSAGQGPLLHFHAQNHRCEWLDSSMLPLGVEEDPMSEGVQSMQMAPGDLIVLLTDGFYEYHNPDREQLGMERIADIILKHHHRPARELLQEILDATTQFARGAPQMDDMTALIIKRLEPSG
jgi:serine phosphatase RsbU (regulator of sigma subunit)